MADAVVEGNSVGAEARIASSRQTREQLDLHGDALARRLQAPALVTLSGELGAGKTTLVQAICRGLGVTEPVTSPTFALVHEYASSVARVVHCDLYRLESMSAVESLGLDDVFADASAIVLVEWPDRAGTLLPTPTLAITLEHLADEPELRLLTEVWAA